MKFNVSPVEMINTGIKIKVMRHMMRHESPMSEREIASVLKVSHMSVNRTLKELASYNLVSFITTGKAHLWRINKLSYGYKALSGIIEKMAQLNLPLNDLKNTIKRGIPSKLVSKAILFGSVAKGTEKPDSDIDLFLLVKDSRAQKAVIAAAGTLSNKCMDIYGNKLSVYVLTQKEFSERKNTNILDEIEKGILLYAQQA